MYNFQEKDAASKLAELESRVANLEMLRTPIDEIIYSRMKTIVDLLQPRVCNFPLFRIGANGDGGYLLVNHKLDGDVLSIGVGDNISADIDLIQNRQSQVYAFDPFVERPVDAPNEFHFFPIGYSASDSKSFKNANLSKILELIPEAPRLALIDIEGAEWGLSSELNLLSQIPQIIIEFHHLTEIINGSFYEKVIDLLAGLSNAYFPIHVHANNAGHTYRFDGITWPDILEVTYLSKELFNTNNPINNDGPFPTAHDFSNTQDRTDIDLNPIFGAKSKFRLELHSNE